MRHITILTAKAALKIVAHTQREARKLEKKLYACAHWHNNPEYSAEADQVYTQRMNDRRSIRTANVVYGFLKGRTYAEVEGNSCRHPLRIADVNVTLQVFDVNKLEFEQWLKAEVVVTEEAA